MIYADTRTEMLKILPQDSTCCEVGVRGGAFSGLILRYTNPKKLHLVDCWEHQEGEYRYDPGNVDQIRQDELYDIVVKRMAKHGDRVEIHRNYSRDADLLFPDSHFDWIYLDADHTYDSVRQDLLLYSKKIKPCGFLCGHDYVEHKGMHFGVIQAVNEFCKDNGWELILLTTKEGFPSYILRRNTWTS